ncbi:MAG TPA: LPS export ABC transporter periplasmic protein LptC [Steroidobacteraceae bacterium]|nr:LPS export ABC transporter periplasmic protein LptC [Steroidobacteraceae bacterium]
MAFRIFTLLAVLALGVSTWILSSPSRRPAPTAAGAASSLPGYYLKNAVMTDYDEKGAVSVRIHADRIDQVDHGPEVALYNVRVDYQSPQGQTWVLLGDTGRVETGGKIVDVAGNVRLEEQSSEHAGAAVMHTDTLRYDVANALATTQSDVRIDFGVHTLTARGLVANLKERTMRLESKVNGRFQP